MSTTPYLTPAVVSMRRATSQRNAQVIVSHLDARLASVELVGWPALEQSLRDELSLAISIARSMGYSVSVPTAIVRRVESTERPPRVRRLTCGSCGLTRPRAGSVVVYRDGKRAMVCPACAGLR